MQGWSTHGANWSGCIKKRHSCGGSHPRQCLLEDTQCWGWWAMRHYEIKMPTHLSSQSHCFKSKRLVHLCLSIFGPVQEPLLHVTISEQQKCNGQKEHDARLPNGSLDSVIIPSRGWHLQWPAPAALNPSPFLLRCSWSTFWQRKEFCKTGYVGNRLFF